jgi:hypothetical protein
MYKNIFAGDYIKDYLTVKETGEKWCISSRMVALYCVDGKIKGTVK